MILAPSSPSQQRNFLSANRNTRTGSVDLPDDMEKSLSSASTSPCISPVRQIQVIKVKTFHYHKSIKFI